MNTALKISSVMLAFCIGFSASAQNRAYDVFVPIAKYMKKGDADRLSAWFADNLEITILSTTNDSSRNQARQIMKSFFNSYTPRSFTICGRGDVHSDDICQLQGRHIQDTAVEDRENRIVWHTVCNFYKSVSLVVNNMVIVSRSPRESAPVFL